ncbi:MAG: peroxiredoxin [Chloroflexi bacterium]|nr:MAG: peroxiredoxin [Chloroflexota bacterium]
MPSLHVSSTAGGSILLSSLGNPLTVLYLYPMTARPGTPLPDDWDLIPGARGCTPEACSFRDRYADLQTVGADVYGLSSQSTEYQREAVDRLRLPFPLLSDEALALAEALSLPTFTSGGMRLFKRLTMLIGAGRVERVFYPVPSPADHADEVLAALGQQNPAM